MNNGQLMFDSLKSSDLLSHPNSVSPLESHHGPPLTIYTLGRFAVYRGNELIEDSAWKRRKAKSLFKLLLLAPQRQLLKDRVIEWLGRTKTRIEPQTTRPDVAKTHYFCAAEIMQEIMTHLTDASLCQSFLAASPVQVVFAKAVCPVQLPS